MTRMTLLAGPASAHHSIIRPEGIHNERFWRDEFPATYRWLFQGSDE